MNCLNGLIFSCAVYVPACAQQPPGAPTPRPDTPFSAKPSSEEQSDAAHRQLKTMHAVHQRMMNARTPGARRALMAEHSRAMRDGMATLQGLQRGDPMTGGTALPRHHMQQQLAMMHMLMQMMMDRIDMLSEPAK